jgi:hypothetical protein
MRYIPESLKQKINKANQTLYENANPQMDVLLRRARSGLTSTDLFYVQTIREGTDLEALGIDLQRTDVNKAPSKAYNIYIKNGICKVATKNMPSKAKEQWLDVLTIGAATDCDIAFDGRWYKDSKYRWQLVTIGNPWLFYVTAGNLYTQQWDSAPVLLAEGVTKIAALRGWKNTYMWNHDQGVICAYIKSGTVYYRNFCQQPPDQPALWEIERQVGFPTPAQNVALFRTNDYRTGFLCESEGQMYWTLTARNWANMAIEPHFVSAGITDVKVNFLPITFTDINLEHKVSVGITDTKAMLCPAIWPQVTSISNPDEFTIEIETDLPLYGDLTGLQSYFTVTDSVGTPYTVLSTMKYEERLVLTLENFMSASGDMTVTLNEQVIFAQVEGGCMMELTLNETFTPELTPPEGYTDHNITAGITNVVVDFKEITYTDIYDGADHNITAGITDVSVTFIHIDDINP